MLRYERYVPEGVKDGAPLIVLLHGRGSNKEDLMGLQPYLPTAAMVLTPEAPFPGARLGYGPGWAWYRFLGRNRPDPETFEAGQEQLHQFLTELPGNLPVKPGPLILGGFSQGATSSLAYALRYPGAVRNVIVFSGYLADHPSVQPTPDRVKGMRIFWGHGTQDPMIPHDLAEEGRGILRQAGADLTVFDYPMGHSIDEAELDDVLTWIEEAT